jgi:meiosis induction protein kinase IME2/SME1
MSVLDEKITQKIGRQLSVASNNHYDAEVHRQQAERALNGNSGLISPPSGQKESFFSHLRKRARRFSGRHQTPISPTVDDLEAQVGCGPWQSNRSSMVVDPCQLPTPSYKTDTHEALDKALRAVKDNLESSSPTQGGYAPNPPSHQINPSSVLKRHHSLNQQQNSRSADNLIGAARNGGPVSSRTRRAQARGVRQYETPDEEDELLDEALTSAHKAMKRMDRSSSTDYLHKGTDGSVGDRKPLRQSKSKPAMSNPYPTPSPTANGNAVLFGQGITPSSQPLKETIRKDDNDSRHKWPTPPYEGNEWSDAAVASIWAASSRF